MRIRITGQLWNQIYTTLMIIATINLVVIVKLFYNSIFRNGFNKCFIKRFKKILLWTITISKIGLFYLDELCFRIIHTNTHFSNWGCKFLFEKNIENINNIPTDIQWRTPDLFKKMSETNIWASLTNLFFTFFKFLKQFPLFPCVKTK